MTRILSHGQANAKRTRHIKILRTHKGVETFAEAVASMPERENWRFVLVGPENECTEAMVRAPRYAGRVMCTGAVPHPEMPRYLAMADVLAVPLGTGLMASSQMPCKVYEAMAMGKPVLASAVGDVPEVLADCGYLAEAGDAESVAAALRRIADHPEEAAAKGARAREKCVREYGSERAKMHLKDIVDRMLG